ncbi:LysR family transcriptional regulator [Phreatobacter sp.]|uniref:LysR family transcriptional regulator n=1 Tax=Phreatobacter sp. TaxID=1966341 RepID=UPI003F72E984
MHKSIRHLDLNLLVVFEAVYSAGNISHAARQLALTQPAVSNAIARLREHFDDALFVREGRGVRPTIRSQQMIGPVRDALRLVDEQLNAGRQIDLPSYKRLFRVVVVDALEPFIMPLVIREIDAHAPGITIENRPASRGQVIDDLIAGTLDLACYTYQASQPGVVMVPINPIDVVAVTRRDHPVIRDRLDIETFMSHGHVTFIHELKSKVHIERDIAAGAGARRVPYQTGTLWSIAAIAGRSDLIGILPRNFAAELADGFNLSLYETPVPIAEQFHYMMWHERNDRDIGHQWLRQRLSEAAVGAFGTAPLQSAAAPG